MILVDTNVLMYAVGDKHPLRREARRFFEETLERRTPLATSAEVLQELLHAYLPLARLLVERHPGLGGRDLLHLATCIRHEVTEIRSFDRPLTAAFRGR